MGALRAGLGLGLGLGLLAAAPLHAQSADDHPGRAVYDKWCAGCHGVDGAGDGPAAGYMLPRPRDFTQGLYQIRTTQSGALPTDDDILHIIDVGMPGTAMPGWRGQLSSDDRAALVDYLKSFSAFFETLPPAEPLDLGSAPSADEEALAEGREFYQQIECWKCHGQAGRGDGGSAPTLEDDDGLPIRAADLTANWRFTGGGTVEDIYRRLRTGLDGTPMPSFSDLVDAGFMTDEQLWNLAHYVRSLAPEETPELREVVRAAQVEGELPASPDDSAWAAAERFYLPLVAQIIVPQRWFSPTVSGVWVQALHDGDELALRLAWTDPSRSPDPRWMEWQERVLSTVEPVASDDAVQPALRPDAFAVQFPQRVPEGRERPYFLMGDNRNPVYLWHWRSATPEAVASLDRTPAVDPNADTPAEGPSPAAELDPVAFEALARGLGQIEPLPEGEQTLRSRAVWRDGQWQVVLRRPITTADGGADADADTPQLQFRTGEPIPMALFAWDGSNGEEGTRGAISSWYYIYLDFPTPTSVYTTPVIAMMMTAGLGLVVVVRARRREKRYNGERDDPDDEPSRRQT